MIARSVIHFDARDALPEMLAELRPFIRTSARRLAGHDRALAKDLEQEAAIRLWQLDPTRFDASDAGYVRSALYKRMQDAARRERSARGGKNDVIGGL